jgi:cytochrome c biogenesis protein CcmG/thiol:disulfide interchange protein DsbE
MTVQEQAVAVLVLLVLVAGLGACGGQTSSTQNIGINQGNVAVDFQLLSLEGEEISLSQYQGSVVLINFWATWCPPCRAEIPDIEKAYQARSNDGFVVLGIAVEQAHSLVAPFVEIMGMSYPVLLDERSQVYKTYRIPGLPVSILVDRDGVIRVRHVGILARAQLDEYLDQVSP